MQTGPYLVHLFLGQKTRRWRLISFRGKQGGEWRGIVDVIAIRKDTSRPSGEEIKRGDLFEIILVQMKGGSARLPIDQELDRLQAVKKRYHAKEIVLFTWAKGKCQFSKLKKNKTWDYPVNPKQIFG